MRIVVDNIIPFAEEIFGPLGDVVAVETGEISPRHVRDADAKRTEYFLRKRDDIIDNNAHPLI